MPQDATQTTSFHFADSLVTRVRELGHPLCVGLDPDLDRIPPLFRRGTMAPGSPDTAAALEDFVGTVVDRLEGRVAVVKPQIAFYEQLGSRGLAALENIVERAHARGLLVLLDAKRGDIGSTAEAYARAYLEPSAMAPADAMTLNAYLGLDTLEPFVARARAHGRALFVLVRTSNRGAGDLQDLDASGLPVHRSLARALSPLAEELRGPDTGWSNLGCVLGATWPEQAERVREDLPHSLFLVPGYGHQGGGAADALRGLVPGPRGLEGGIVSSARGILYAPGTDTDDRGSWEKALDNAVDAAVSELGEAAA